MLVTRTHARVGGSDGAGQEGQSVGEVPNTQSFQTTVNIGVKEERKKWWIFHDSINSPLVQK